MAASLDSLLSAMSGRHVKSFHTAWRHCLCRHSHTHHIPESVASGPGRPAPTPASLASGLMHVCTGGIHRLNTRLANSAMGF